MGGTVPGTSWLGAALLNRDYAAPRGRAVSADISGCLSLEVGAGSIRGLGGLIVPHRGARCHNKKPSGPGPPVPGQKPWLRLDSSWRPSPPERPQPGWRSRQLCRLSSGRHACVQRLDLGPGRGKGERARWDRQRDGVSCKPKPLWTAPELRSPACWAPPVPPGSQAVTTSSQMSQRDPPPHSPSPAALCYPFRLVMLNWGQC